MYICLQVAAADALSQFYYPPVAAVSISYPKEAIRTECLINGELKGFGQLHPRSQGVETLGEFDFKKKSIRSVVKVSCWIKLSGLLSAGTIYSSSLFPNRAPAGRVLLLNYIGGATNAGILSKVG